MAIVTRLLDAFFRTLDAVDAARERLDRVLGRQPEPVVTSWDAAPPSSSSVSGAESASSWTQQAPATSFKDGKAAPAKPAKEPDASKAKKKAAPRKAAAKGGKKASRKGSVDRTGADVDSPRARAVLDKLVGDNARVVAEEATLDGKKVLARVLWALGAAEAAGAEQGLTAADASALLHLAAGMEVFSTNIARACRDETDLIAEGSPDGRSKRYKLTAAGRAAAQGLETRPLAER